MGTVEVINDVRQLEKFLNNKDILEVALRNKDGKIKAIKKFMIESIPDNNEEMKKAVDNLGKKINSLQAGNKHIDMELGNVQKLQYLNLAMEGANLCATVVGFIIISNKLDKMKSKVNEILDTVKKIENINENYRFEKVMGNYRSMLDGIKINEPFTTREYENLINDEYAILKLLYDAFMDNLVSDTESHLAIMMELMSMYAHTITVFDEMYYFKYHEIITDGQVWSNSHDNWMGIFKLFKSKKFIERIQDFAIIDMDFNQREMDLLVDKLVSVVNDEKKIIKDHQKLLLYFKGQDKYNQYNQILNESINQDLNAAMSELPTKDQELLAVKVQEARTALGYV